MIALGLTHVLLTLLGLVALWTGGGQLVRARLILAVLLLAPLLLAICPRFELPTSLILPNQPPLVVNLPDQPPVASAGSGALIGQTRVIDWSQPVLAVWVLGVLIGLARLAWDFLRLRRRLQGLTAICPQDESRVRAHLPTTADAFSLRCLTDPKATGPYSFRMVRGLLVMPEVLPDSASLGCMVRHEWAHLRHRDSLESVIWRLVCALYWWNPLVHALAKRVMELQEWRADSEASGDCRQQALVLSRVLLDLASAKAYQPLVQSMVEGTVSPLKRRVQRLIDPPQSRVWRVHLSHGVLMIGVLSSVAACAQLLPSKAPQGGFQADVSTQSTMEAMDGELTSRAMEKRLAKVKRAADTEDLVAVEVVIYEMEPSKNEHLSARKTSILSPSDRRAFHASMRGGTQVSYPRVLTKNRRGVMIRSVVNEPVFRTLDNGKEVSMGDLPIGTMFSVGPVILKSGDIHCDIELTVSSIIGERIIEGQRFPIASSRIYNAPMTIPSGQTLCINGLDEVNAANSKGKTLTVMVTPTRLSPEQSAAHFSDEREQQKEVRKDPTSPR